MKRRRLSGRRKQFGVSPELGYHILSGGTEGENGEEINGQEIDGSELDG